MSAKNEKKDIALKKMSKYLLQGAEMLTESCPDCDVPLIVNKKTNRIFCAGCNQTYQIQGSEQKQNQKLQNETSPDGIENAEAVLLGKLDLIINQLASKNFEMKTELEILDLILSNLLKIKQLK